MGKVTTDEAGVAQLNMLAANLDTSTADIKSAAMQLEEAFEERKSVLGPHTDQIQAILETIDDEQQSGATATSRISKRLQIVASAIQELISKQLPSGGKGKTR